jgi:uncharacterized membrane protein YgdD (TMEM256/DUF423 family)
VLGPYEYGVWLVGILLETAVVLCAYKKNALRRYLLLNVYMAASVLVSIGRYNILSHYGFASKEYLYFYYYSDSLLTIALYFALMSLYSHIFSDLNAERYIRIGTAILLSGTALFSYAVVQQSSSKLVTHFVVELSQNLYFVGLVLTYILWAAVLKMRETRTRLIQLVLALGLYFSVFAASYALRNLYPSLHNVWPYLTPISGCVLPLAWAYAFWRIPEDARLVPSRLAVVPR